MSKIALQKIVGKAVISDNFRAGLLNERRAEVIDGFDLEPHERDQILAIQAETLAEFAAEIQQITQPRSFSASFEGFDAHIGGCGAPLNLAAAGYPASD
ncbi:MAG: hypothetical protein AAB427_04455 [Chloroflexota bacterium]